MSQTCYQFRIPKVKKHKKVISLGSPYDVPRWKWLHWVMKKLKLLKQSHYVDYTESYYTVTIAEDSVFDVLRKGMWEIERIKYDRPKRIYIGTDYFEDLIGSVAINESITYPVKFYGCEIVATPYLEGMLPVWE